MRSIKLSNHFPRTLSSRWWSLLFILLLAGLFITGCSTVERANTVTPAALPAASGDIVGVAPIDEVTINILESFPVQIEVVANGTLPDECTKIGNISTEKVDSDFLITITSIRPAVAVCNEVETPYEETIPLDAEGLPAGVYLVLVNGVGDRFELSVDNVLAAETEEPEITEEEVAVSVYSDEEQLVLSAAQTALADGLGVESESLEVVSLDAAEWPDACLGLAQEGELCLLQVTPGYKVQFGYEGTTYTLRTDDTGQIVRPESTIEPIEVEVVEEEPEQVAEEPSSESSEQAETAEPTCTDKATFVKDLNIKDNAKIQPNASFEKTWRIRNIGTCTWTTDYAVVFAKGDQMEGVNSVALTKDVPPNKTIDITIPMVAPASKGKYKGFWALQNAEGVDFGIGKKAKDPFYVQIVVPKNSTKPPAPKGATLSGFTWHDLCDNGQEGESLPSAPPPGCIEAGDGTYIGNGISEEGEPRIGGMEVTLGEGTCPSSDLATVIARANGVYVFTELEPGTYCITIDSLSRHNVPILIPGAWTYPDSRDGRQTVVVGADEEKLDINFGWDYQFAP